MLHSPSSVISLLVAEGKIIPLQRNARCHSACALGMTDSCHQSHFQQGDGMKKCYPAPVRPDK
jgi:hypothetical protein